MKGTHHGVDNFTSMFNVRRRGAPDREHISSRNVSSIFLSRWHSHAVLLHQLLHVPYLRLFAWCLRRGVESNCRLMCMRKSVGAGDEVW